MSKVIVRIKGGLGNQLFCYAAARRLALVNNAELVIDDVTGFSRDCDYRRRYMLDKFSISARKATPAERMEPFERYRRAALKWWSARKAFEDRCCLDQEGVDFDQRLLGLKLTQTIYLEGLWQSEGYFQDIENIIRNDLKILPPEDVGNQELAREIKNKLSVAVHVRWFDEPGQQGGYNLTPDYYARAISFFEKTLQSPHYFVFSDRPQQARSRMIWPDARVTFVFQNQGDENAFADLWLMSQCQHFIIANSTFSWWGAWLGEFGNKIVMAPNIRKTDKAAWGFKGLIPTGWIVQ